jgi:hypothetical protein
MRGDVMAPFGGAQTALLRNSINLQHLYRKIITTPPLLRATVNLSTSLWTNRQPSRAPERNCGNRSHFGQTIGTFWPFCFW